MGSSLARKPIGRTSSLSHRDAKSSGVCCSQLLRRTGALHAEASSKFSPRILNPMRRYRIHFGLPPLSGPNKRVSKQSYLARLVPSFRSGAFFVSQTLQIITRWWSRSVASVTPPTCSAACDHYQTGFLHDASPQPLLPCSRDVRPPGYYAPPCPPTQGSRWLNMQECTFTNPYPYRNRQLLTCLGSKGPSITTARLQLRVSF